MRRSEFRKKVIDLLYIHSMSGNFEKEEYSKEILDRFIGVIDNLHEIDSIISDNLVGYTIDRLNLVDKAIIRNAVYEMKFTKLPNEIAINEAINLTKKYSNLDDDAAKRFNNKLLDNISKKISK